MAGRGARESVDYEHAPMVNRLVDSVLHHEHFFTSGPQHGYRNRMTYALRDDGSAFGDHPLAAPEVEALAEWMHQWVRGESAAAKLAPCLYDEMTVKLTRRRQLMLTLSVVLPEGDQALCRRWCAEELPLLAAALLAAFPAVGSAAYWVPGRHAAPQGTSALGFRAPPGPFSEYPYTVFLGEQKLTEEIPAPAPHGSLPYFISHGTFSEINHFMEDRIFPAVAGFVRQPLGACGSLAGTLDGKVDLLVTGRDTNALSLGLGRVCGPWAAIHAVSHCHLVADDCAHNQHDFFPDLQGYRPQQCDKKDMGAWIGGLPDERPIVAVCSSGRHGLRPAMIEALRAKKNIVRIVYDSCNPVSLRKDLARFMGGDSGFVLEDFRSFDFFASTQYMVSIACLVRRKRTLILPVGPCGVGKSSLALALKEGAGTACGLTVFERDQVFAEHRGILPHAVPLVRPDSGPEMTAGDGAKVAGAAEWKQWGEKELLAIVEEVWHSDKCGKCGGNGQARRLATLMHAIQVASPTAAAAIGKPSSKWFKQRPSHFVLKPVKGGQQLVTLAAEIAAWEEQKVRQRALETAVSRAAHCDALGVPSDASAEVVRKRFHALARTAHPDKGGDPVAFAALQASYEALLGVQVVTLREALAATHADLVRFLTPHARKEWALGESAEHNDANSVVGNGATLLLDSTNGGMEGRDHARRISGARVFVVQLRPTQLLEAGAEPTERWLLGRAANRPAHPAFPTDDLPDKQLQKVRDVLKGVEWAGGDEEERAKVLATGGCVLECDPCDSRALAELPYKLWVRVFVGAAVRRHVDGLLLVGDDNI